MKIQLTKPQGAYRKGEVIELDAKRATEMIADGRAVPAHDTTLIETASLGFETETADATPRRIP